jgi:transposase-like protein
MKCPCCGADMVLIKEIDKLVSYKCLGCGLSNTELKKSQ